MKFNIGSNFDNNLIDEIEKISLLYNISKNNINFFGALKGYGHSLNRFHNKYADNGINHIKYIIKKGFSFSYLFNNIVYDFSNDKHIDSFLSELICIGVNELTIYDIKFIEYLEKKFPNFNINVSTVLRINKIDDIYKIIKYKNVKKIILSHSLNRNIKELIVIINILKKKNILVELVANEPAMCVDCDVCPHYYSLSIGDKIGEGKNGCTSKEKVYSSKTIIYPHILHLYEKIGLNSLKFGTRQTDTLRTINLLDSYFSNKRIGKIEDILGDMFENYTK